MSTSCQLNVVHFAVILYSYIYSHQVFTDMLDIYSRISCIYLLCIYKKFKLFSANSKNMSDVFVRCICSRPSLRHGSRSSGRVILWSDFLDACWVERQSRTVTVCLPSEKTLPFLFQLLITKYESFMVQKTHTVVASLKKSCIKLHNVDPDTKVDEM